MAARRDRLPQPLTNFVGRAQDLAILGEHIATSRGVTLTGPGGVGKSRLAVEVARSQLGERDADAWLVDLSKPGNVARALAAMIDVREEPGVNLTGSLVAALRHRTALLVFDNCERSAAECAGVIEALIGECRDIVIVATSRQPLGYASEVVHAVAPLEIGPSGGDAPRLFVDRARFASPGFAETRANAETIRAICRRVDGLPLAIELAASCTRLLAPEQILARLDDRFRLLASVGRTVDPRHRTLRATIDWSYDLLSPNEQTLLRRVSVFAGGFTAAAVRAACSGDGLEDERIADLLDRLVATSLAFVDLDGERFRMLDTIHEYAREKLAASGELEHWRAAHRDWFLAMAELASDALLGSGQSLWLESLDAEASNLHSALSWTLDEARDGAVALRFVSALYRFWELHGYESEGRQWIESAVLLADGREPALEADARFGLAILAFSQSDFATARDEVITCLELRRRLGDREGIARSLNLYSLAMDYLNDFALSVTLQEESLALSRELGLTSAVHQGTYHLGLLALRQGELDRAMECLAASAEGWKSTGNRIAAAGADINLAETMRLCGDLDGARALTASVLDVARRTGTSRLEAASLVQLGQVDVDAGEMAAAIESFVEGAELHRRSGAREGLIDIVEGLFILAARSGNIDLAARLEAAATRERRVLPAPRDPARQRELDATLECRGVAESPVWTLEQALEAGLRCFGTGSAASNHPHVDETIRLI